jgi:dTDP-4-amino-4,6-dideoxygalactose transaminase
LAVDYFGRPAEPDFVSLVRSRPDIGWVQDCAHSLGTDPAWGDWLLYSPRKVIGVPDGGILVAQHEDLPNLPTVAGTDFAFALPSIERFEDRGETDNQRWYAHYVQAEAAMTAGAQAMSRLSLELLQSADVGIDGDLRRKNYAILNARLREQAFFRDARISFVPLGFPIRVRSAVTLAEQLAQKRIFAARHWRSLPSDASIFADEHRLARELLTLPCDYRYGEPEMHRVADAVVEALSEQT